MGLAEELQGNIDSSNPAVHMLPGASAKTRSRNDGFLSAE